MPFVSPILFYRQWDKTFCGKPGPNGKCIKHKNNLHRILVDMALNIARFSAPPHSYLVFFPSKKIFMRIFISISRNAHLYKQSFIFPSENVSIFMSFVKYSLRFIVYWRFCLYIPYI